MNWMSGSDVCGKNCVRIWEQSRRRLLHLLDAQNTLLVDSTLMSFTAGFKLAWGIATELEADGLYSFEKEDEEPISEVNTHG